MNTMQKDSFVFRKEWRDAVAGLPVDIRAEIYEAIIEYALTGTVSVGMKPMANAAFALVKARIDYDNSLSAKRSAAGRKGGAPKGNSNASKQAKQAKTTKKQAKTSKGCLEDIPPIPPIEDNIDSSQSSESAHINSAREDFEKWLGESCPYISKHYKLLSDEELMKLKSEYGSKAIAEECMNIENRVDLRKKYSNLYRTLLNWLKRNNHGTTQTNQGTGQVSDRPSDSELREQSIRIMQRRKAERLARQAEVRDGRELFDEGQP